MDPSATIVNQLIKFVFEVLRAKHGQDADVESDISDRLEHHLNMVAKWASAIHAESFASQLDADDASIALQFSTLPRSFRISGANRSATVSELELYQGGEATMILGDPGAGKTTTLKRLAFQVLTRDKFSDEDELQYPLLLRLRDFKPGDSIVTKISTTVGIKYDTRIVRTNILVEDERGKKTPKTIEKAELFSGTKLLSEVVCEFLDDSRALVLVDGLDEAHRSIASELRDELEELVLHSSRFRCIATCRSGDYLRRLEGFRAVEISPLDDDQILILSHRFHDDGKSFIGDLKSKPYFELARRPLFLSLLMLHFEESDYLPDRPNEVYERMVQISLEKWDRERGIKRKSKYRGFHPQQKARFLSELSFHLTYSFEKTTFTNRDIVSIYLQLAEKYSLPSDESHLVAKEIESHTGLFVESFNGAFEFSHLTIQEYLCAEYLVRNPYSDKLLFFINNRPGPLAIAIAISTDPSSWLAALVLGSHSRMQRISPTVVPSFLDRLTLEKPYFERSKELGFAVLHLFFYAYGQSTQELDRFLGYKNVKESVADALTHYVSTSPDYGDGTVFVKLIEGFTKIGDFTLPRKGKLSASALRVIFEVTGLMMNEVEETTSGTSTWFFSYPNSLA